MSDQNQPGKPSRVLRVNNVAKRLGLSERTVRHMAAHGRIPGFKTGRRAWFFNALEIESHMAAAANRESA